MLLSSVAEAQSSERPSYFMPQLFREPNTSCCCRRRWCTGLGRIIRFRSQKRRRFGPTLGLLSLDN